ncbi:type IV pilus twitching motility protein PilT, partial [Lactococcus petauri]|uniref:type IV pilus twitching motility protein PilT n=1 Tax=Lactococcus petauri TaxID=1940789 RepID=UPI0021F21396
TSPLHVLTIEDPIEFLYRDLKATITQREVGSDVSTLEQGLIAGLRQDPDVIVIGELRTKEMIQAALTAAETGHLVISTLHTNDA